MFVYHGIPENMMGTTLYPLTQLRSTQPQIFEEEIRKYKGREQVMAQIVPILNCKWNDVLHLTPLDPKETLRALREAGGNPPNQGFWKIPVSMLDEDTTVLFSYQRTDMAFEKQYKRFSRSEYREIKTIPEGTFEYYKEVYTKGSRPLMYHLVPHILTLKPIETKALEICYWHDL